MQLINSFSVIHAGFKSRDENYVNSDRASSGSLKPGVDLARPAVSSPTHYGAVQTFFVLYPTT